MSMMKTREQNKKERTSVPSVVCKYTGTTKSRVNDDDALICASGNNQNSYFHLLVNYVYFQWCRTPLRGRLDAKSDRCGRIVLFVSMDGHSYRDTQPITTSYSNEPTKEVV